MDLESYEAIAEETILEISIHAIAGAIHLRTIQAKDTLQNHKVVMLIDSASTHNFIDSALAYHLGLHITRNPGLQVMALQEKELFNLEGDGFLLMHMVGSYIEKELPTDLHSLLKEFQQVDYLGHIISKDGVTVDPTKIQPVMEWPKSTSQEGVCGFPSLIGYYKEFISGLGRIATGLTKLLTFARFNWTLKAAKSFK
ncbi:hypothetical protein FEM48_Zijuj06G0147500 [Ziziphus jujuba var. spinosa]|uniref:Uncharacterized protein n=1 Tax=Ziziphus jujuba var. spinosa TaxID=714518 RepID=A0A978V9W6_ZIZJJ|nr:hypothetical protein FEM48_Zijuj06G0147500 [Ziziphus jujuba var. spinosa]